MAKLTIKSPEQTNEILSKLAPHWKGCFSTATIENAQVAKSSARNYMFGVIMNKAFIKLSKSCNGFKAGAVVSLPDIYADDSASNIASLIIYRLGNSGLTKDPTIAEM
jgi:hypothetical protein